MRGCAGGARVPIAGNAFGDGDLDDLAAVGLQLDERIPRVDAAEVEQERDVAARRGADARRNAHRPRAARPDHRPARRATGSAAPHRGGGRPADRAAVSPRTRRRCAPAPAATRRETESRAAAAPGTARSSCRRKMSRAARRRRRAPARRPSPSRRSRSSSSHRASPARRRPRRTRGPSSRAACHAPTPGIRGSATACRRGRRRRRRRSGSRPSQ